MGTRALIGCVTALLMFQLAAPRHARAQESEAAVAAAKELFAAGDAAYASGDYELAVDKFEQAYRLSARPLLLFNIANARERQGDYARAAEALRRYLPDAPDKERDAVAERARRLEERAAAAAATRSELAELRARTCPVCEQPGEERSGTLTRNLLWAGGGAAVVTGLALGLVAREAGIDAERSCVDGLCSVEAEQALDREQNFALAADVAIGVGLVAVGAGVYLWWKRRGERAPDRGAAVTPLAGRGMWGAGVVGSF